MTLTWSASAHPHSFGVRERLLALACAGIACAALTYLAVTQRFGLIADIFFDPGAISVVVENQPPPPPPVVRELPPPPPLEQHLAPSDPLGPPTPTGIVTTISAPAEDPSPALLTNAAFLERPSGRDFERYFPARALERGVSGRVVLDCSVAASGRLSCAVTAEEPAGWGFGEASLRAARHFRVAPATTDGAPASGGRLSVPMTWQVN